MSDLKCTCPGLTYRISCPVHGFKGDEVAPTPRPSEGLDFEKAVDAASYPGEYDWEQDLPKFHAALNAQHLAAVARAREEGATEERGRWEKRAAVLLWIGDDHGSKWNGKVNDNKILSSLSGFKAGDRIYWRELAKRVLHFLEAR